MNQLSWLTQYQLQSLTRREYDWVFAFEHHTQLVVTCLWRLIKAGRVRVTSADQGQIFGRPAPVDSAVEVNQHVAGLCLTRVDLREGTLDLELEFTDGSIIQIIPDSSGYEAYEISSDESQFIATGGGELVVLGDPPLSGIPKRE